MVCYRGVYSDKTTYTGRHDSVDSVWYQDKLYVADTEAGVFGKVLPTDKRYWHEVANKPITIKSIINGKDKQENAQGSNEHQRAL